MMTKCSFGRVAEYLFKLFKSERVQYSTCVCVGVCVCDGVCVCLIEFVMKNENTFRALKTIPKKQKR